ncbi:MAG: UDP-N-acetylmuramoyl-tripeptide--D-alanyl-D-alanine ligase [Cytophagaceae bacterium]|nr:UDP-N-acetylmuramoyl-tripeptide--D-alanyl-D-alanine ligase [Cytophagaceae bacterium]MDW8455590.1 UDP-N-acetylmuramoyl-tripeptide--D-alanyl-D-alanine ligase [Cytophagaceae bacterium]
MNISEIYEIYLQSTGISTDTRKIQAGNIFFALKGTTYDANTFADKALAEGANYAVIDNPEYKRTEKHILVKDTLDCLQQLALFHRNQFNIPIIAITGSNGKTTTKELVGAVLSKKYITHVTQGNLNNHIGIPLTLLAMKPGTEIAVIEMGANHQGEIKSYCEYTRPTHGIITNIGKAHLEGFGGIEGVKKGKGELYNYLLKHDGNIFINTTDKTLMEMSHFKNPITYPQPGDFLQCKMLDSSPYLRIQTESGLQFETQLTGTYNFANISAALCVAKYFHVSEHDAVEAIMDYIPQNNRSQVIKKGTNTIILDAYNANPTSMREAISNLAILRMDFKKCLMLGDMYELGEESEAEHESLGKFIGQHAFDIVCLCGKHMKYAHKACPASKYFESKEELHKYLMDEKINNAYILIKGSRGMSMETLLEAL